jgi:hypothetical protein
MQTNILQIIFSNETDKKISASLFQLFSDNSGLTAQSSYSYGVNSNNNYFNQLKLWLLKNKLNANLIRLQFTTNHNDNETNHIYFRKFIYKSANPFGSSMEMPMFTVGESFSPKQFQSGIIDVPIDAEFDGYSTDVMFDVYPKETIVISVFEKITEERKKKYKERLKKFGQDFDFENKIEVIDKGLTPFKGFPVVVENTSDEDMVIDLFSADHYRKLVEYDKNGLVYCVYQGRGSFGVKNCVMPDNEKEYSYIATIESIKRESSFKYYDCIRIVNPNQHELNDIIVNGREIKTKGYVEDKVLIKESDINGMEEGSLIDVGCRIATDVRLEGKNEFDSFIVTVPPKTNMMFSFGKHDEIKDSKPQRLVSGFSNEAIEKEEESEK